MGTLVETDIDNFIRGHKNKLQDERNNLSDKVRYVGAQSNSPRGRRQWDKQNQQGTRPAEQTQGGSTGQDRTGLRVGDSVEVSRKQQQLQQERQKEYNELLAQREYQQKARSAGQGYTQGEAGYDGADPASTYRKGPLSEQERVQRMYDLQIAQKQQLLQDQYRREQEENQRRNTDQPPNLNFNENSNRRRLDEERAREYQEHLAKQQPLSFRGKEPTPENLRQGFPIDHSKQDEQKRKLINERQKEYNELLQKKQQQQSKNRRAEVLEGTGATLPVGEYDDRRKQQLADERHNEFLRQQQEKQQQQSNGRRADVLEGTGATLPVGEYDDRRKQQLADERHNEFLRQQQQKLDSERRTGLPPKPPTPNHFFNTIGQHEKTQQALNEERKKEYNQRPQARGRTGARTEQQENLASLPIKGHDSAEVKKPTPSEGYLFNFSLPWFERSRSYCDIKPYSRHSVPTSPTGRSPRGPPPDQATLPGLGNSDSAEGPKGVRRGWSTPTYEEILDQKRRDENRRRQEEDQAFGAPRMRGYASDGALNKLEDNLRDRHLEKEFEARKVRFDDERNLNRGILEDDNWLNPGRREQEYQQLMHKMGDDQAAPEARLEAPVVDQAPDMAARVQNQGQYLASLNIGAVPGLGVGSERTDSAKRRVKAQYNRDLRIQMQDAQDGKLREKRHGLPVNASGYLDPEKSSTRIRGLGDIGGQSPRREYKTRDVEPYHSRILKADSGDNFQVPLERGRRRERDPGLNDLGFTGLLESRRNVGAVAPPPGLLYQPSTYVTGGTGIGGVNSSIDEAYHYLGLKNPLDVADNGPGFSGGYGGGGGGGGGGGVPNLNLGGDFGGGGGYRGSPTPRVTFADEPVSYRKRDRSKERISPYQFPSDEDTRSRSRTDTQSYAQELERQIAEKRMAKQREREKQERYDQKLEEEIKNYNPFGRGGGGAPIKDGAGNAVADLRALQRGGESSRRVSPITVSHAQYSDRPPSPSDDKYRPPPAQNNALGEGTYARGGHGIFGHPKTESEKDASDKYKDDLRLQIEDKRRRAAMEKQKEKEEEDKENRRLEEQRQKIQNEYEEDQRKIRAREEEARKRNEEMKQAADNRKKEAQRQRQEQDDERMKEQQEQIERERQERQREADRVKSPPVPAMKAKTDDRVANSPPLPAHRGDRERSANSQRSQRSYRAQPSPAAGPSQDRPNSSDVLTQLASMRKQLQSERRRVENALENSKNEPDVFDPRTIQRPPPTKLVFENAVNKNASLIPPKTQTSDSPNTRNLQQFNELKFKSDSDSRRNFRSLFPEAPITNNTLEAQQDAMIRQQEEMLRGMKERNQYEPSPASVNLGYGRHGNVSARSQLASNSAFIDVDALNSFPEDFDDMAGVRNNSARARRRDRYSPRVPSVNGYGSQASLDVDRIQRKNDDRLRKLQNMTTVNRNHYGGDDVSLTDPDDILDRFMTKQTHNRPPSGQTLQDDSWLRPGSLAL